MTRFRSPETLRQNPRSPYTMAISFLLLLTVLLAAPARAVEITKYPVLVNMIDELVKEEGMEREQLEHWLGDAVYKDSIIKSITRPAEALPWHRYRGIFINDGAIENGVKFMREHKQSLERAEEKYGVDAEIITAIIGIETRFGKVKGNHRVIDSLTTLSVGYPRRSAFFSKELKHYLILAKKNGFDPLQTKGSYAGAIGIPQFMPSSYLAYSVDFDGDEIRDLVDNFEDAIGSVANYLHRHRWKQGQPVVTALGIGDDSKLDKLHTTGLKPNRNITELKDRIEIEASRNDWKVGVLRMQTKSGYDYRIGFHNFFVITTYNRSQNYAMVAYDLSSEIKRRLN